MYSKAAVLRSDKEQRYFTSDQEWMDFGETVAYAGICTFRLTGFKEIHEIDFRNTGLHKAGDVIGSLYYHEYKIDIHLPVSAIVLSFNKELLEGNESMILNHPKTAVFFAFVVPAQPYERKGLIISSQYQMKNKSLWQCTGRFFYNHNEKKQ